MSSWVAYKSHKKSSSNLHVELVESMCRCWILHIWSHSIRVFASFVHLVLSGTSLVTHLYTQITKDKQTVRASEKLVRSFLVFSYVALLLFFFLIFVLILMLQEPLGFCFPSHFSAIIWWFALTEQKVVPPSAREYRTCLTAPVCRSLLTGDTKTSCLWENAFTLVTRIMETLLLSLLVT